MKKLTLNLTQFRILYKAYNSNENTLIIYNRRDIEEAYKLIDKNSDLFLLNNMGDGDYHFHIKDLGAVLDILKYNSKYEKDV